MNPNAPITNSAIYGARLRSCLYVRTYPSNFFLRPSRTRVDWLSHESKPTDKREQNDWLDGWNKFGRNTVNVCIKGRHCQQRKRYQERRIHSSPDRCIVHHWGKNIATHPKKIPVPQLYCSCLSVGLLSRESRWTPIWLDHIKISPELSHRQKAFNLRPLLS